MSDKKAVVIRDDYLDGIMAVTVNAPSEFDETAREVDSAILDAYEASWLAMRDAEKAVRAAWAEAPEVPNPSYVAPGDEE